MCGRFTLSELEKVYKKFKIKVKEPKFNIPPFSKVLVLDQDSKSSFMSWKFKPLWAEKFVINARSETLHQKPYFKNVSRCIVIVDGWYEWRRSQNLKRPYYHHINGAIFFLGGIYNESGCAIVTKQSHQNLLHVHYRQPVIIEESKISNWLSGEDIFQSSLADNIVVHEVSTIVNNTKINNVDLIKNINIS